MKELMKIFFFLILLMLNQSVHAAAFLRGNLLISATQYTFSSRTNAAAFLGFDSFSVGVFGQYEAPHSYVRDEMYGLSLRTGMNWFFELGGGPFQKTFEGVGGNGYGGYLMLGKQLGQRAQVSLMAVAKDISSGGLEKRSITEFYPSLGITWGN